MGTTSPPHGELSESKRKDASHLWTSQPAAPLQVQRGAEEERAAGQREPPGCRSPSTRCRRSPVGGEEGGQQLQPQCQLPCPATSTDEHFWPIAICANPACLSSPDHQGGQTANSSCQG